LIFSNFKPILTHFLVRQTTLSTWGVVGKTMPETSFRAYKVLGGSGASPKEAPEKNSFGNHYVFDGEDVAVRDEEHKIDAVLGKDHGIVVGGIVAAVNGGSLGEGIAGLDTLGGGKLIRFEVDGVDDLALGGGMTGDLQLTEAIEVIVAVAGTAFHLCGGVGGGELIEREKLAGGQHDVTHFVGVDDLLVGLAVGLGIGIGGLVVAVGGALGGELGGVIVVRDNGAGHQAQGEDGG